MEECGLTGSQGSVTLHDTSKLDTGTSSEKHIDCDSVLESSASVVVKVEDNQAVLEPDSCEISSEHKNTSEEQNVKVNISSKALGIIEVKKPSKITLRLRGSPGAKDTGTSNTSENQGLKRIKPQTGIRSSGCKKKRDPRTLIDRLFRAARKGNKEDFKKLLYRKHDNIVNDFNSSENSRGISLGRRGNEGGDVSLNEVEESILDGSHSSNDEISSDEEDFIKVDSKLVIHETDAETENIVTDRNKTLGDINRSTEPRILKKRGEIGVENTANRKAKEPVLATINTETRNTHTSETSYGSKRKIGENRTCLTTKKLRTALDVKAVEDFINQSLNDKKLRLIKANLSNTNSSDDVCVKVEPVEQNLSDDLNKGFLKNIHEAKPVSKDCKAKQVSENAETKQVCEEGDSISINKFACQHCGKAYKNFVPLRHHQNNYHHTENSFTCEACSKHFSSLDSLKAHEHVHINEETSYCELCQKTFSSRAAARRHSDNVHIVEKLRPYICDICDYAFTCQWHLREHQNIHTRQHKHVCPVCKKAFSHLGSMNRHAKRLHGFDTSTWTYCKSLPY